MFKDKPLHEIREAYKGATHYNRLPAYHQPAEVAHAWGLDFLLWNSVKYLSRAGHKATTNMSAIEKEVDDLNKAIDYIQMRINVIEGRTPLNFKEKETKDTNEIPWYKRPVTGPEDPWYYQNVIDLNDRRKEQKEIDASDYYAKLYKDEDMRECYGDC